MKRNLEETLIFFKPDAIKLNLVNTIYKEFILKNKFKIISIKPMLVTKDLILKHYEKNLALCTSDVINRVVNFYDNELILLMILQKSKAIKDMRDILGNSDPSLASRNTIRGKYGSDSYLTAEKEKRSCRNLVHASDSYDEYIRERLIWFGY